MLFLYGSQTVEKDWYVKEMFPVFFCRIYYVRSGYVIYRDEHGCRNLKSGCLYVFPSTKPYEMEQDPESPLNCLHLHVDITPCLLPELLEIPVKEGTFLEGLIETMDVRIRKYPDKKVDAVMEQLASALISYMTEEKLIFQAPDKIAEVISYIAEHIREKITVEKLSEMCGYNKQYFIRVFASYLKRTPHQYLISYRMKLAVSMLMEGKSVSETADLTGYPELRNFIRAFRKYYGYAPGQIKRYLYRENI